MRTIQGMYKTANTTQLVPLETFLLEEGKVYITDAITDESANAFMQQIMYLEQKYPNRAIHIYINSPGGVIDAGLAIRDIIKGLEKRNMEGVFCETKEDALTKALSYIEEGSSVTWGGSMSISEIGLMDAVKNGNYEIIDRSVAKNYDEQREIFSKAVLADYYLMSSNAITLDGELINIDGTGNRVACLTYGPKNVIMIVGMNKVVNDVEDGIKRVRNFASPPNTLRLGLKTPCSMTGRCGNCYGDTCICSQIVVTRRQSAAMRGRIKIILVGESLGY